jgi:hypothetical protein
MLYYLLVFFTYAWLAGILGCAALLLFRGSRLLLRTSPLAPGQMAWPVMGLLVLTLPLWIEAALLEFQCRSAGLTLAKQHQATTEGLYWRSHAVAANGYSSGIRLGTDPLRQAFALGALRALAEGRIAYLEVPYEPMGDPQSTLNQKLFIALRADTGRECVGEPLSSAWGQLPADLCIAWETTQGLRTRFEVVGLHGEGHSGTTVGIKDRQTGEEIARYTRVVATRASETLLALRGIRTVQPRSCNRSMTDILPGASLVSLIFLEPNGTALNPETVDQYAKSAWSVTQPPMAEVVVPEGRAGIDYWIARGAVRRLTAHDLKLWQAAKGSSEAGPATSVPDDVFVIQADITLPTGLSGGHSVTWLVPQGAKIPPGPRGHSTFLEVGKGCLWSPFRCQ